MKKTISVIGGRSANAKNLTIAYNLGRLIAEHGYNLVCGGMGGIMKEVSRGAKEAGGLTIGILPSYTKSDANQYIDIAIPTGIGIARNVVVVASGDVVIAIDGSYGTLSEIALAFNLGKRVIGINTHNISGIIKAKDEIEAINIATKLLIEDR